MEKKKKQPTILGHCSLEQGRSEMPPPLGTAGMGDAVSQSGCGQRRCRRPFPHRVIKELPWVGETAWGEEERPLLMATGPALEEGWTMRVGCSGCVGGR